MSKRWSKLQSRQYNLMDPKAEFQIHLALYEMNSKDGWHGNKLPRYFITIGKEIIFDYPKDFDTTRIYGSNSYPWQTDMDSISDLIEFYIELPEDKLMNTIEGDIWGLTDIQRACDRRIGKRRLEKIRKETEDERILRIIAKRLGSECRHIKEC